MSRDESQPGVSAFRSIVALRRTENSLHLGTHSTSHLHPSTPTRPSCGRLMAFRRKHPHGCLPPGDVLSSIHRFHPRGYTHTRALLSIVYHHFHSYLALRENKGELIINGLTRPLCPLAARQQHPALRRRQRDQCRAEGQPGAKRARRAARPRRRQIGRAHV